MSYALQLAEKGRFTCSPNPMVGCVIVRDEKIIGEGWHERAGQAHAEIRALQDCSTDPAGATLYVTLEPCCHHGRTPPCINAIIDAKIAKVIVGCLDPNPKISGQGISALQQAGISVEMSELNEACRDLNRYFFHAMQQQKPYIIAKWAMSLDGKIATKTHDSKWISNSSSRERVHQLRHSVDAIVVGSGTVIHDDPELTVRLSEQTIAKDEQPLRIILNGQRELPTNAKIFQKTLPGQTLLASEIMQKTSYDLADFLEKLNFMEIRSVLIEGGSEVFTQFLQADLVDEIHCYIAPKLIGGKTALTPFMGDGYKTVAAKNHFELVSTEVLVQDVLLIYRRGEA
jgi:diaminohydroxyphosphoribosylaminopyrimidine deaminase/5-amino-6-(5-phosphoribosylamino)uracil reductase